MAALKVIKRDPFKRGDTPNFRYEFDPPYVGFNWATVQLDCAFTKVGSPTDNSGAAAVRLNQALTVNADNTAYYNFGLTHAESLTLVPGATYNDECQLKESGTNYITPIQGETKILQDYVI
jgi:hypothetical protein